MCLIISVLVFVASNVTRTVRYVPPSGHTLASARGVEAKFVRTSKLLGVCETVECTAFHNTLWTERIVTASIYPSFYSQVSGTLMQIVLVRK